MSCRARCRSQLKEEAEAATRLDLRRKEKNAVVNKAQRAAWDGVDKFKGRRMDNKIAGVMRCFWHEEVPIIRLSPFLVRVEAKLLNDAVEKPL